MSQPTRIGSVEANVSGESVLWFVRYVSQVSASCLWPCDYSHRYFRREAP